MADFLSLPFCIHVLICRNLNLCDCLNYSQISPTCHDAVYYIFSHRTQLDLSSAISFSPYHYPLMTLSTDLFLTVLRAHTRATQIRNFLIPIDFTAFTDLADYFNLYWTHTFMPSHDDSTGDCSEVCGTFVGHIRGHLNQIHYLGFYGASNLQQGQKMYELLNVYDDYYGININQEGFTVTLLNDHDNWSTVDLDAPYTRCTNCDIALEVSDIYPNQLCQICSYIQSYFSSESDQD